jgi:hypothetical protein
MLYIDYFAVDPLHGDVTFWRRFRMNQKLFMNIVLGIKEYDTYFVCKQDCVSTIGFSPIQKCTSALRVLAYGASAGTQDDYMHMAESTAIECIYWFYMALVVLFGELCLRTPAIEDIARIMVQNAVRGFSRILGSIDCMHYAWKNCVFAW